MAVDKNKALETALTQIEKQFGKGAVMRLGENKHMNIEHISTGSLSLDIALGIGGLPRGRIVEIYGPESSGKTTLSLHCIAEGQKNGGNVAFIDVEHALDPTYAAALGVDVDSLLVSQPDTGEDALEIAEALIRSGAIDVIVIDSVAALVPKAEIEGEMGDSHVGLHARLMSQALRKLTPVVSKNNCVVIFINQLREKVGVMFGNPETTTGGRALKFYASVRLDVRRIDTLRHLSRMVRLLVTEPESRLLRIRLPLHSEKQSLIFFLEKVYLQKEILLILLLMQVLSRRVEHGSHMRAIRLDRDERTLSSSFLIIQR